MLTVTIITLNEEKNIGRCLDSIRNLADEIVVVDSGSTDKTVEIAKGEGAKVFVREFDNFANQKNYAAQKATGEWILSLDADEEVSPELRREIMVLLKKNEYVAFSIPRKNIILGKFIRYTRWQPELDRHIWLWKRGVGKWFGEVHEELRVNGRVGKLIGAKIHYQHETVKKFLEMMNGYSEIEAKKRIKESTKFSYSGLFFDPIYNFLVRYFYRFGFLDGWRGFVLSYLMAIYHLEVWLKIWEKQR